MQTSGGNTTKRRDRGARIYVAAALPFIAMLIPFAGTNASADPISDTLCTVRGLVNILVEPCAQASPEPQPSAAPTAAPTAQPSTRASASPGAPPKARTTTATTTSGAEAPVQAGTIPPSQSAQPAPSGSDVNESTAGDDGSVPMATTPAPIRSVFGFADVAFAAIMSGGLVWLLAARRRRRVDAEATAAASRVERMKDEIVSNLSHELRTPLTPVVGYATMLRSGKVPAAETRKIAEKLIGASEQLERTIDLLVTFASIRGGSITPARNRLNVATIAERIAADHRSRNPKRTITVTPSPALPAVDGDARLLAGAIDQLLDNAIKFSPSGKPVMVGLHPGPPESGTVEIVVKDEGVGISPADLPHIFDEFRQVDGSNTRSFGGVGLGLAFASSVAEMHGGTITADSRPGEGSTFTLRIRSAATAQPVPVRAPRFTRHARKAVA